MTTMWRHNRRNRADMEPNKVLEWNSSSEKKKQNKIRTIANCGVERGQGPVLSVSFFLISLLLLLLLNSVK